jgi:hypothetical protein
MEKTLMICDEHPLPENNGGSIRTMNFVRFFKQLGTVDLIYNKRRPSHTGAPGVFRKEYFSPIRYLGDKQSRALRIRLHRLIHRLPWIIGDISLDSRNEFLSILHSEQYDIILVRYLINTGCIFDLPKEYRKRVIFDYDDILLDSMFRVYYGEPNSLYLKFRFHLEKRILKNYERKCLKSGAALFCSEEDRKKIVGLNERWNAHIVPNIYENESFREFEFGDGFGKMGSILYVGSVSYKPNMEGLTWFLKEIYPVILGRFPETKFYIVGRWDSTNDFFNSLQGVQFYPNVPDIKPFFKDCGAVIVPLLSGGGTRIKILEAGLANRPVLSTPLGAYGLGLMDGRDALLFSDREDFLFQYSRLFHKDFYHSLVNHLHNLVISKYSQVHFNKAMQKVIESLPIQ